MSIDYQLKKSYKRKTIAIHVKNTLVTVLAPHFVPLSYIDRLVNKKHQWIIDKIEQQKSTEYFSQHKQSAFDNGEFQLFDRTIKLTLIVSQNSSTQFNGSELVLSASPRVKNLALYHQNQLKEFLKTALNIYLQKRVIELAEVMNLKYVNFQLKRYKRRWGACNSKKQLSFNLLLAGAPEWVIDYVVIHELAHLKHLNHSKEFWSLVNKYCCEVKKAESWLKIEGKKLEI